MTAAATRFFADDRDRVDEAYHVMLALDEGTATAAERRRFDRTLADIRKKVVRPLARLSRSERFRYVDRLPHARRELVLEAMPRRMYDHYLQDERKGPPRPKPKAKAKAKAKGRKRDSEDYYFEGVKARATDKALVLHASVENLRSSLGLHPRVMSKLGLTETDLRRARADELRRYALSSPAVLSSLRLRRWVDTVGLSGLEGLDPDKL